MTLRPTSRFLWLAAALISGVLFYAGLGIVVLTLWSFK